MQKLIRCFFHGIMLLAPTVVLADEVQGGAGFNAAQATAQKQTEEIAKIAAYLQNLGEYFGYDITDYCTSGGACSNSASGTSTSPSQSNSSYSNTLLSPNDTLSLQLNFYNSYIGSLLGGGASDSLNFQPIVPETMQSFNYINNLAGSTFNSPPYEPSPLIDQQTYQTNPISQSIINILATPNYSYCYENNSTKLNRNCVFLTKERVMYNVIGTIPTTTTAFTTAYNQQLISQLNSETLLAPLIYSTTPTQTDNASTTANAASTGLTAQTQAQKAMNFIRYATGAVVPITLPDKDVYNTLFVNATSGLAVNQVAPSAAIIKFLISIRVYAAQNSISLNNLYYMFSRRMPQTSVPAQGGQGQSSSEALNEFVMASWRLFNPAKNDGSLNSQWLTKINGASSATVQKEIAILLAEMNYQLYLTRQLEERLLLTQSIANIQNTFISRPDGSALNQNNASSGP